MPRRSQVDGPSYFHVLNRSVRRGRLFDDAGDYRAFIEALRVAQERVPTPILAYCIMPNHFHLVVGPVDIAVLSRFMHRLTVVHAMRWHRHHGTTGSGAVYQGRFKSYPIRDETHFLFVCRYVERNPLRADLVARAEQWPWSSLGRDCKICNLELTEWPIPRPSAWLELVNRGGDRVP
jgi:putative transposase